MSLDKKKTKGKRGRKPTSKIISLKQTKSKANDDLIAHIPLDEETIKKYMTETDSEAELLNNKKIDIFFETDNKNKKKNEVLVLKNENKKLKKQIELLKKENGIKDSKVFKTKVNFYNETFKNNVNEKTTNELACWWCCHKFSEIPVGVPNKILKNKFHVFGNFCSFNCAAAYIHKLDDWKISERLSLLHQMYYSIYDIDDYESIKSAPAKETLKLFGGPLTIEEFRNTSKNHNRDYRLIVPPMTSIIPLVEENNKEKNKCHYSTNKNIPLNNLKISNKIEKLKLKRSKPLHSSKYSLIETMGLKTDNN
jgi:hypothetical protein